MLLDRVIAFLIFQTWLCSAASVLGERDLQKLSVDSISSLVSHPDPAKNIDPGNPDSHLSRILIPRAPQTENNTLVRKYIVSTLQKLNWHVEEDEFIDVTPIGPKKFVNVIATKDPEATRRVILSAHFDSKWFSKYPENQFVGATDSAAPCAMMLDLAEALNPLLDERASRISDFDDDDDDISGTTLQLVFFDGEEAFHSWTDTDSTYGSRHLAEKWADSYVSLSSLRKRRLLPPQTTLISTIEHLILLDLLGAKYPKIKSYFTDTAWLFDWMKGVETRLGQSGHLTTTPGVDTSYDSFFEPRANVAHNVFTIQDDHIPFIQRGVSILHIISNPFPGVWHQLSDDATALDIPTMRQWNLILRVFMAEYLNLRPPPTATRSSNEDRTVDDSPKVQKSDSEL